MEPASPYFEQLNALEGMPPLVFTWDIVRIRRQTAPFIEVAGAFERDPEKLGWEDIAATDAWNDDEGHGEYLLQCRLLDEPPARLSRTAVYS